MRISRRKFDEGPVDLTPEGLKRLENRLQHLKEALPDFISEAQRTAAYGDRSDNAEYKDAKGTLRRTYRQIWSIEEQLKRVVVIKKDKHASGTVQLGSTVVLKQKSGVQRTFEILGPYETDPEKGRISHKSPLGAALMNRAKGDTVTIETPNGSQEYHILDIR